jgi:hypothetical protein
MVKELTNDPIFVSIMMRRFNNASTSVGKTVGTNIGMFLDAVFTRGTLSLAQKVGGSAKRRGRNTTRKIRGGNPVAEAAKLAEEEAKRQAEEEAARVAAEEAEAARLAAEKAAKKFKGKQQRQTVRSQQPQQQQQQQQPPLEEETPEGKERKALIMRHASNRNQAASQSKEELETNIDAEVNKHKAVMAGLNASHNAMITQPDLTEEQKQGFQQAHAQNLAAAQQQHDNTLAAIRQQHQENQQRKMAKLDTTHQKQLDNLNAKILNKAQAAGRVAAITAQQAIANNGKTPGLFTRIGQSAQRGLAGSNTWNKTKKATSAAGSMMASGVASGASLVGTGTVAAGRVVASLGKRGAIAVGNRIMNRGKSIVKAPGALLHGAQHLASAISHTHPLHNAAAAAKVLAKGANAASNAMAKSGPAQRATRNSRNGKQPIPKGEEEKVQDLIEEYLEEVVKKLSNRIRTTELQLLNRILSALTEIVLKNKNYFIQEINHSIASIANSGMNTKFREQFIEAIIMNNRSIITKAVYKAIKENGTAPEFGNPDYVTTLVQNTIKLIPQIRIT